MSILEYHKGTIARTLLLALGTSLGALALSIIATTGWFFAPKNMRGMVAFLLSFPLIIPPYISSFSYSILLKSHVARSFMGNSPELHLMQAMGILSLCLYPYVFLLLVQRMRMIDPSQERIISLYPIGVLSKIQTLYFPHVRSTLLSGFGIVFLYVIADFGAVSILRIDTITTELYQALVRRFSYGEGSVLSGVLISISFGVLAIQSRLSGIGVISARKQDTMIDRGRNVHRVIALGMVSVLSTLTLIVPFAMISVWFIQFIGSSSPLKEIWFDSQGMIEIVITSLSIAMSTSIMSPLLAFIISSFGIISGTKYLIRFAYFSSVVLYGLPALVIAVSLLTLKFLIPYGYSAGFIIMLIGYNVRFTGVSFMSLRPAIESIPPSYLSIGMTFLKGYRARLHTIVFPLVRTHLVQSAHFIFFSSLRELTIPLILLPVGFQTLSVRIWATANEGLYIFASPFIVLLLVLSLPSFLWYSRSLNEHSESPKL